MKILAIETSTHLGSIAVLVQGQVQAEVTAFVRAKHGETLLPRIEQALELAGMTLEDLDLLAVGLGPGSFTGTRVGLACAKGLALGTGLPLVGVCSLRATARLLAQREALVAVVMDAHKSEVYLAAYELGADAMVPLLEVIAPMHAKPAEAAQHLLRAAQGKRTIVCGDGLAVYGDVFSASLGKDAEFRSDVFGHPRATFLAEEACAIFRDQGPSDLAGLEPLYVRGSDAKLPVYSVS